MLFLAKSSFLQNKSDIKVAGQSDVQKKIFESLFKKTSVRVDSVSRRVPPSEIRRSAKRGGSQLESGLRGALSWSVLFLAQTSFLQ